MARVPAILKALLHHDVIDAYINIRFTSARHFHTPEAEQ